MRAGAQRRGTGETIRAALPCADLRDFAMSEATEPAAMIAALASLFGVTLTTLLTHQQLVDWGWRIT